MNIPSDLKYTQHHVWVSFLDERTVRVGVTDFACAAAGRIEFVNLPMAGDAATSDEPMADYESADGVDDLISPVSGVITAVNSALEADPDSVNSDPYAAWFAEIGDVTDEGDLLSDEEYREFCAGLL